MSTAQVPAETTSLLNRLLAYVERDAGNLVLRKDAIREACNTGQWEIARNLLDAGLLSHSEEAELLAFSGFAYLQAQRYADAARALSAAIAQGLRAAEPRYNLAFAYFMMERHADALELLMDPAIQQAVSVALLLRARCLHHLNRLLEAVADCRAHLAVFADDPEAGGLLALLLHEQSYAEEARVLVDAVLAKDPKQLEALLTRAYLQSDAREYDAAKTSFSTLLEAHPLCGRGWLGLALIDLMQMRMETARRYAGFAAAHMPQHIGTWHVLAWLEIMRGDVAAAQTALEKSLAIDRNFGETHGGLAVVAALQGREEEARSGIKRALRLDSQSKSARYAEMLLLERGGRRAEAQAAFDAMLAMPVAQSDMQYRDLVGLHMKYLRDRAAVSATLATRH